MFNPTHSFAYRIRQQTSDARQRKKRRIDEPPSAEEKAKYRVEALRAKKKGVQSQYEEYRDSAQTFELIHECMSSFLHLYSLNIEHLTGSNPAISSSSSAAPIEGKWDAESQKERSEGKEKEMEVEGEENSSCLEAIVKEYDSRLGISLPDILSYTPVTRSSDQTLAFYDQDSLMHGTPDFHCESVQRLIDLIEMLEGLALHPSGALAVQCGSEPVKDELLCKVHDEKYIASVRNTLPDSPDDGPAV